MPTLPLLPQPAPCVQAPPHWQRIDFISDLHLDANEPATFDAWAQHMAHTPADALFILGDLFEVWVGDDTQDPFALHCMAVLKATAQRMPVYFMCGNRDFLMGEGLMAACGARALADPSVLELGHTRWLLVHGDAQCLGDVRYQTFRAQVRSAARRAAIVAKTPEAITFLAMDDDTPGLAYLAINGVSPTPRQVADGAYPLRSQLTLVSRGGSGKHVEAFLRYFEKPQPYGALDGLMFANPR